MKMVAWSIYDKDTEHKISLENACELLERGSMEAKMKKGDTYLSKIWLDLENKPLLMRITKIASGMVYYRPYYGKHDDGSDLLGSPAKFPIEQARRWLVMD